MVWSWFIGLVAVVVFARGYGAQPVNLALSQPAWSTENSTRSPASQGVDGDIASMAFISIYDNAWPFLAVDLGTKFELDNIVVHIASVEPAYDAAINCGVSDTTYTSLDASVADQLLNCTSMLSMGGSGGASYVERCRPGASGRYVYLYMEAYGTITIMDTYEFEVYGHLVETPADGRSYSVNMECRDDLARTRGLPACSEVDLTRLRPPCELRGPKDTQGLIQVAAVSGSSELPRDSRRPDPMICAALSKKIYYCVEPMSAIGQDLAFSISCPFRNITIG